MLPKKTKAAPAGDGNGDGQAEECPTPPPPLLGSAGRGGGIFVSTNQIAIGSLSLPCLLLLVLSVLLPRRRRRKKAVEHRRDLLRHAVITGGSSGIGLAVASECLAVGCRRVTIVARDEAKLSEAKATLESQIEKMGLEEFDTVPTASAVSCDVSDPAAIAIAAERICQKAAKKKGGGGGGGGDDDPPTLLFNVAGTSSSSSFLETPLTEFDRLMRINYLGSVYVTRAFLPYMLGRRDSTSLAEEHVAPPATIVFTSSLAGQLGIFGYTAYSPTKYALRGFAEALQMEVGRHGVHVVMSYPPDTDTPGYELEQVGKPKETHLISEGAGLFRAEDVARKMVKSALRSRPPFAVYFGLEGWMLSTLTAGMSPVHGLLDASCQVILMGFLRLVSLFYLMDFRRIVRNAAGHLGDGKETKKGGEVEAKEGGSETSKAKEEDGKAKDE